MILRISPSQLASAAMLQRHCARRAARVVSFESSRHATARRTIRQPSATSPPLFPISSRLYTTNAATSSTAPENSLAPPPDLNATERHIWEKLFNALEGTTKLVVQDISGGCGSMYGIEIESAAFKGLSMVRQQRLVNEVLKEEIQGWHGVQLRTRAAQ